IVRTATDQEDMEIVAAIDAPSTPHAGRDAGELAGIKRLGVEISGADGIDETLKETNPDVLVDFTLAEAAVENVKAAAKSGVAVVVGTTGFSSKQRKEMEKAIEEAEIPAIIAPNMSIGVNVFFKLAEQTAKLLKDYDVELIETHHRKKVDAPSGTALCAAQIVAEASGKDFEKSVKFGRPKGKIGERTREEIGIHAVRAGDVAGDHKLVFAGPSERLEIVHRAQSRQVFANGVMRAIRYIVEEGRRKPGEVQDMQDVLSLK
ncbi:dihydrodipicolinate reductase, partial [candidate division MSBL1 archaeon SCGC-AAA261D19]